MTVSVVDLLEVVDVEPQLCHRVAVPARSGQVRAHVLMEVAVVVEAGQRVRLSLQLEAGACLRVVESESRWVTEPLRELELFAVEVRVVAEPVDAEDALDGVACD